MKKHKIGPDMLNDMAKERWEQYMKKPGIFDVFRSWYHEVFNIRIQENLNKSLNHYEEEI